MTTNLLSSTSTLIVRIPGYVDIPAFQEKSRARKSIVRALIRSLQLKDVTLVYAGQWPEEADTQTHLSGDGILLSINVLNPGRTLTEYNLSQDTLIRRFRKELQCNAEQILIDRKTPGGTRHIEIYLKSRNPQPVAPQPHYAFAVSSGTYRPLTASF